MSGQAGALNIRQVMQVFSATASVRDRETECCGVLAERIVAQNEGLVVEDNEALRNVAVRLLTSLGYQILTAGDADEALRIIASDAKIDLLFTDVVIPGQMDGIDLGKRTKVERPGIKVLLTSGFTERAAARGNGYKSEAEPLPMLLGKPYRKAELAKVVAAALSNEKPE